MKKLTTVLLSTAVLATLANAEKITQEFEPAKDTSSFDGVELSWNMDLTFNYQALDQKYKYANPLITSKPTELQGGLTLPTANIDFNAKVMKGFNVKLETMLSSHHHNETYVKGGYAAIDSLDWLLPGLAKEFMEHATIKVGVHDINFGDAHFRRTDNADVFNNPFVHNLAVESYLQGGMVELLYRMPNINSFIVLGATNGSANPNDVKKTEGSSSIPALYTKLGYDTQINKDSRFRISGSFFHTDGNGNNNLYAGDKAGTVSTDIFDFNGNIMGHHIERYDFGSNWDPMFGYKNLKVGMINIFTKYKNTELFALAETAKSESKELFHYSMELVQRFYADKIYLAARYENAKLDTSGDPTEDELKQFQLSAGWFFSKNAMLKVEYIKQERTGMDNPMSIVDNFVGGEAEFDGFMVSTALSF